MKPTIEVLRAACPEVDERLVRAHWERLDERYFSRFDLPRIALHLQGLAKLSPEHPLELLIEPLPSDQIACTVLAFDYLGEFSLITGCMAGTGYSILSGGIHTYHREPDVVAVPVPRGRRRPPRTDPFLRRRIIDHFVGELSPELTLSEWSWSFRTQLEALLRSLEQGTPEALQDAKHRVNEMVAGRLQALKLPVQAVLFPMEIKLENGLGPFTRLSLVSEDTPAFLFAFSNALSLWRFSIEHVRISTVKRRIEDQIDFVDAQGVPVEDPGLLDQLKLGILLTKQFTYFLGNAPDPYAALSRFEKLVSDLIALPQAGQWVELLSDPRILQDLARLLGASDFLWEDMIRLQYETLLPMLRPHLQQGGFAPPVGTLPERLRQVVSAALTYPERRQRLNQFKDQEIFLIDLDHILNPSVDFKRLAEHLTVLAETVVAEALELAYGELTRRFGRPRTVAGLEVPIAVLGLGKLGGAALGYASDIELMFVYSDQGRTDGPTPVDNTEFFDQLVKELRTLILAKREGIFNLDLRLRPHGEDGPLACSLESFCNYYGPGGPAHAYERLSLVRMRAVGGEPELGNQIERLRDEFIYASASINFKDLRELRAKQFLEKNRPGVLNAKFSPGGLVDLEYDVQILQVMYGKDQPGLRTPRIHDALEGLRRAGVLGQEESQDLIAAYDFLRDLINGLRMLRGSAQDLFLPATGSDEYLHLARRLDYLPQAGLDPSQQLHLEFETRTASIRAFVDRHFGRDTLPGPASGSVADLILSEPLAPELRQQILRQAGFRSSERADANLQSIAKAAGSSDGPLRREQLARLVLLACDQLKRLADPDRALNNWEHLVRVLPDPVGHFQQLFAQPTRIELLMNILATSQFLADTLVRNPEYFEAATDPAKLRRSRERAEYQADLQALTIADHDEQDWLNQLRSYRRRELLRIGTRDICLRHSLLEITADLSHLADALVEAALGRAWQKVEARSRELPSDLRHRFVVLAFGKLGGNELNYSSDIDLLGVYASGPDPQTPGLEAFTAVMEHVRELLTRYTEEGYLFRVDLRLRPYGGEGQLVYSDRALADYYRTQASLSEVQSLLKIRAIAGDQALGERVLDQLRAVLRRGAAAQAVAEAIEKNRQTVIKRIGAAKDVKSGLGGIRDIEFLVQGLQLGHVLQDPELLEGNTLRAIERLGEKHWLTPEMTGQLSADYIFLRRVEHYLQILEDQQIHALPEDPDELEALGKRMLGVQTTAGKFLEQLEQCLNRTHQAYRALLLHK